MNGMTDPELLRQYADHHAEPAFGELVRRHVDLVYSAALRMVRDSQLAEDVTQGVFLALAQSAGQLVNRPVLAGWLHRTTQNLAANAVRTEVRRRAREQKAAAMHEQLQPEPDAVWDQVAPHLDAALGELSEPDRDALLLRFFQHKSAREMGQILGVSDAAAQKRVDRALERLRGFLTRRGVAVGAGGLVAALSAHAIQAAPAGLAAALSATAAGTTLTTAAVITGTKTIVMTTMQKAVLAGTLAAVAGTSLYEARQAAHWREEAQTLQQRQRPLTDQLERLQRDRDEATNRLAALLAALATKPAGGTSNELLKLRGEVARLRVADAQAQRDPANGVAHAWLNRVNQLKDYVAQHPDEAIPEFKYLTEREWLNVADAGLATEDFRTPSDYDRALQSLRSQAASRFANLVQAALHKYAEATGGQFPTDLAQLQPFCEAGVADTLLQLYKIIPASVVRDSTAGPGPVHMMLKIDGDWVITRRQRVTANSTSRLAIFANGDAYWQSPPGSDD